MSEQEILASIEYDPYAVLIAHMDSEQFFRDREGINAFREAGNRFAHQCGRYRKHLNDSFSSFSGQVRAPDDDEDLEFDDFLFNPACFVTFGDSDNLAFVAMDDFDLATRLISNIDLPIRQTCLAFSPRLSSLGIKNNKIFCDIAETCGTPLQYSEQPSTEASYHKFLAERPLIAVTYYKFNGMAVLGPGLLMQEAALRAMASQVEKAVDDVKKAAPAGTTIHEAAKSFRCAFLDPQGWSDLVTIMLCTDYSVIATVLSKLRCLTHKDIYDAAAPRIEGYIRDFGAHEKMAAAFQAAAQERWSQNCEGDSLLSDNHVLCATFTTLGISYEAFKQEEPPQKKGTDNNNYYSGDVIAETKFVCSAGHCTRIREIADTKYRAALKSKPGHSWYCVGHGDFVYQQLLHKDYDVNHVVALSDLVRQVKSMRDVPMPSTEQFYLNPHILDMCTDIRIPILPISLTTPTTKHVETRIVLDQIRKDFFSESSAGGFSIRKLQGQLGRLQLPAPLSSAIGFLFTDYANCLANVFLYDHVIDLHDILTALFGLLMKGPSQSASKVVQGVLCTTPVLDSQDHDDLVEIADLLRDALGNRVQITFQDAERWGETLDVRGLGFNRLLSAADVPLKCGLGLLRRVVKGDVVLPSDPNAPRKQSQSPSPETADATERRIGGASKITCDARSHSHRLDVGYNSDYFLTSVDLNMAHLTQPQKLLIHLHETAHLICHSLRESPCPHPAYSCHQSGMFCHIHPVHNPDGKSNGHLRDRFEDIFAEMLVHQLVFGNDYHTYLRNYAANYCLFEITPADNHKDQAFFRFFEVLIRAFLISDPFRRPAHYASYPPSQPLPDMIREGIAHFDRMIDDLSPFLLDFEDVWLPRKDQARDYFPQVFAESYPAVCCIWQDVQAIYSDICIGNSHGTPGLDPNPDDQDALIRQISGVLSAGLHEIVRADQYLRLQPVDFA